MKRGKILENLLTKRTWDQKTPPVKSALKLATSEPHVGYYPGWKRRLIAGSPSPQSSCSVCPPISSYPLICMWNMDFLNKTKQTWALELTVGSSFTLLSTSLNSSNISNDSTMTLQGLNALCTLSDQYSPSNSSFSWKSYLRESLPNVNLALENKAEYGQIG